jgi:hypothetical protein
MSRDEWATIAARMEAYWPGSPFSQTVQSLWFERLAAYDGRQVAVAIDVVMAEGSAFLPSLGQLLKAISLDPSVPTSADAVQLVERCSRDTDRPLPSDLHPLVVSFIERQGRKRLGQVPLGDPDWGEKHRRDLERAWEAHVEAFEGREVAARAAGAGGDLKHLDPLAALARPQLHLTRPDDN